MTDINREGGLVTVQVDPTQQIDKSQAGLVLGKEDSLAVAVKEELKRVPDEEIIKQRLNDPEVKAQLIGTAQYLNERFHGNWFDLAQMMKKTSWKTVNDCLRVLNLLKLSDLLMAKMDKVEKYKITLTKDVRKEIIQAQILVHQKHIENLNAELVQLDEAETLNLEGSNGTATEKVADETEKA